MQESITHLRDWLGAGSINIFGMPYAGKDTQGQTLADLFGGELMGGGHILRNSVIPERVAKIMEAGKLIPTEDYISIVLPYLSHEKFANIPLVLSSVGRWQGEEVGVLQAADEAGHPLKAVILLEVDEQIAKARQQAGSEDRGPRADDAPDIFKDRLEEFRTKTLPVIEFYESHNLLIRIDGSKQPPEVTSQILQGLTNFAFGSPET